MTEDLKKQVLEAIAKRIASPKQYVMDGESITMDSPDDLAKLIKMLKEADEAADGKNSGKAPFKVSVCRTNSTIF